MTPSFAEMFWNVLELSSMSLYHTVMYHAVMYCTKGVIREQKVPRVPGDKRCQGINGAKLKGAKGAWVKSSEGLLGGRVFSGTHFRSSLSPEEGPSSFIC